ncbi:MAG: alpha-amylase [Desulfurococcaceae archaeon]
MSALTDVVLVFEVHQPYRLDRRAYEKVISKAMRGVLELKDLEEAILDQGLNKIVIERAAKKCYIPATKIIIDGLNEFKNLERRFNVSFSISGVLIEQLFKWAPEVIDIFSEAYETGAVEFIGQTYYHSLAAFIPPAFDELREQFEEHKKLMKEVFGAELTSAENTEFIYNNDIACAVYSMGYKTILTEGVDWILGWRSPNYVYRGYLCDVKVLTRNYRLSDDVGYRFSDKNWDQYPLTADKYAAWLAATPGDVILLAMDYETFGEHHWPESGIYEFLKWLPREILKWSHLNTVTPREASERNVAKDIYDVPPWRTISWADERDVSAWLGNYMQFNSFKMLTDLRPYVYALGDPGVKRLWKLLTISDHYYYIATKFGSIEQVHSYFSPYKNAVDAYAILVQAISMFAKTIADYISRNPVKVAAAIQLPIEKAFHFTLPSGEYIGLYARNLVELLHRLSEAPPESLSYHLNRGDLQSWVRHVLLLNELADEFNEVAKESLSIEEKRAALIKLIKSMLG